MSHDYLIDRYHNVAFNMSEETHPDDFIVTLSDIGAIQFGSFELKSGLVSPIYLDLRKSFTFPKVLAQLTDLLAKKIDPINFDLICGVPLTALVFASCLAIRHQYPMIAVRKQRKEYGNKNRLEGEYFAGQHCLVVEDLITSGASLLETITPLKEGSLVVTDIVCLLDREQGGKERLEKQGYQVHSAFRLSQVLSVLQDAGRVSADQVQDVLDFMKTNRVGVNE